MASEVDVAVIGAGVAGLAALRSLADAGVRACILEARNKIGGRIHTIHDQRLPHAIELGAEFIHGSAPELVELAQQARLVPFTIEGDRWRPRGGKLTRVNDFWQEMHKVMRYLPEDGEDESFAEFLQREPGGRSAREARTLCRQFVEGFHAAVPRKISAKALAEGGAPSEEGSEEQRIMRIASGYDGIAKFLARGLESQIMMETVVHSIEWEHGGAAISARGNDGTVTIRARAVIVTVPLAVLLADNGDSGAIEFLPQPPVLEKMHSRLAMGSVQKVIMLFRERWWTEKLSSLPKGSSLENLSFLHGETSDYPIWWTLHPAHLPVIVGWAGGPSAFRLAGKPYEEKRDRAITALAKNLGVSRRRVESQVVDVWTHDWDEDPYTRGAYSYPMVGGATAAREFARSVDGTLWFAGEAADAEGRNGTVTGAVGSGRAAAKAVKRALA
jgi:monoamine oxidase